MNKKRIILCFLCVALLLSGLGLLLYSPWKTAKRAEAYRQEIARLLHVQPKQCTLILKRMVTSGEIAKQGQKYLPQEQKAE